MNILIVDDEVRALNAVQRKMNWQKIGIEEVFTAVSKKQAIDIMSSRDIDLLLCDIEMPGGSGLELVQWVRDSHKTTKCVFMTCHADFQYAQKALRLGSLDYILKPIDYDHLSQVIISAVKEIESSKSSDPEAQLLDLARQFWKDYVDGDISPDSDSIRKYWINRGRDFAENSTFLTVMIAIKQWEQDSKSADAKLFMYALRNIAEEILELDCCSHVIVPYSGDKTLVIYNLNSQQTDDLIINIIKDKCFKLADNAASYLKMNLCSYIGEAVEITNIPSQIDILQQLDVNNVSLANKTILLSECRARYRDHKVTSHDHWKMLIRHFQYTRLREEIEREIKMSTAGSMIDRGFLEKMLIDFNVLIYSYVDIRSVKIEDVLGEEYIRESQTRAGKSLEEFLRFVDVILAKMRQLDMRSSVGLDNPIEQAKHYIREHLDRELHVEEIASYVSLNPDYLNRLFKRETGYSLNQFVLQMKINKAKWQMQNSSMSLSEIAADIGYLNYTSFTRAFARICGLTPSEYKREAVINPQYDFSINADKSEKGK